MTAVALRLERNIPDAATCLVYARVSTDAQAATDRASLAEQERQCRALALKLGYNEAELWNDPGRSGTDPRRLEELAAWCEAHPRTRRRGLVVTYSPDRFARLGTQLVGFYAERLTRAGWELRYVDLARTGNALVDGVSGSLRAELAAEESRIKSERTLMGMPERVRQGFWQGGPAPFGYDVGEDGKLTPNADAATVRQLFAAACDPAVSLKAVAATFGMGYTTALWRLDDRKGAYVYRGALVWAARHGRRQLRQAERIENPKAHARIVDAATFDAVQRRLHGGVGKHVPHARGNAPYALSGVVRCPNGHPLTGMGGPKVARYRQLACRTCGVRVNEQRLEATVAEQLAAHAAKATRSPQLKAAVTAVLAAASGTGNAADRDAERRDLEAQRTRLVDAIAAGAIEAADAAPKMQALKAALARLDASQDTTPPTGALRAQLEAALTLCAKFGELWAKATPAERRELFTAFVQAATVDAGGRVTLDVAALPGLHGTDKAGRPLGS